MHKHVFVQVWVCRSHSFSCCSSRVFQFDETETLRGLTTHQISQHDCLADPKDLPLFSFPALELSAWPTPNLLCVTWNQVPKLARPNYLLSPWHRLSILSLVLSSLCVPQRCSLACNSPLMGGGWQGFLSASLLPFDGDKVMSGSSLGRGPSDEWPQPLADISTLISLWGIKIGSIS